MTLDPHPGGVFAQSLELRNRIRVAVDLPVTLRIEGEPAPVHGRTRDLGLGGLCVATRADLDLDAAREIAIALPSAPLVLPVAGRWQADAARDGTLLSGLGFPTLSPQLETRLSALVVESANALASFLCRDSDLRALTLEEVLELAHATRYHDLGPGEPVCGESPGLAEACEPLFVLAWGDVALAFDAADGRRHAAGTLRPGSLFGGAGLVGMHGGDLVFQTESEVRLLRIDVETWRFLETVHPRLALRVGFALLKARSQRLADAFATLRART